MFIVYTATKTIIGEQVNHIWLVQAENRAGAITTTQALYGPGLDLLIIDTADSFVDGVIDVL